MQCNSPFLHVGTVGEKVPSLQVNTAGLVMVQVGLQVGVVVAPVPATVADAPFAILSVQSGGSGTTGDKLTAMTQGQALGHGSQGRVGQGSLGRRRDQNTPQVKGTFPEHLLIKNYA